MIRKGLFFLSCLGISCFLLACSKKLSISTAYFQEVKPGRIGTENKAEFVVHFKKSNKAQDIAIEKVLIVNYKGGDYIFLEPVCNDTSLSRTLKSTAGEEYFAVYLSPGKASARIETLSDKPTNALIQYTIEGKQKTVKVENFSSRGIRHLRN